MEDFSPPLPTFKDKVGFSLPLPNYKVLEGFSSPLSTSKVLAFFSPPLPTVGVWDTLKWLPIFARWDMSFQPCSCQSNSEIKTSRRHPRSMLVPFFLQTLRVLQGSIFCSAWQRNWKRLPWPEHEWTRETCEWCHDGEPAAEWERVWGAYQAKGVMSHGRPKWVADSLECLLCRNAK